MKTLLRRVEEDAVVWGIVATVALFVLLVLYSAFWPFSPYTLYDYGVSPNAVCMGDVAEIHITRKIEEGHYLLVIDGSWRRSGSNHIVESPIGEYSVYSDGKKEVNITSPILQEVPEAQGYWQYRSRIEVHGRVGILPRSQELVPKGTEYIAVLPNDHDKCRIPEKESK
jgi:hypothetical protein